MQFNFNNLVKTTCLTLAASFVFAAGYAQAAPSNALMDPNGFAYFNKDVSSGAVDKSGIEQMLQQRSMVNGQIVSAAPTQGFAAAPVQQVAPTQPAAPVYQAYNAAPVAPTAQVFAAPTQQAGW